MYTSVKLLAVKLWSTVRLKCTGRWSSVCLWSFGILETEASNSISNFLKCDNKQWGCFTHVINCAPRAKHRNAALHMDIGYGLITETKQNIYISYILQHSHYTNYMKQLHTVEVMSMHLCVCLSLTTLHTHLCACFIYNHTKHTSMCMFHL
jgi:hypothetical protein